MSRSKIVVLVSMCVWCAALASPASAQPPAPERSGSEIYQAACSACHGADGKGAPKSQIGFTDVEPPDFTDCQSASPEPDSDWVAQIHYGGPARAFSRRMPSFVDALTDPEIGRVVAFLRTFCSDRRWPRGDLNLPRAFVTEKAFPENETIVTTSVATSGPGAVENLLEYEHRIGARSQYEIGIPFSVLEQETGASKGGVGDITVAFKHVVFDKLNAGTIVSAGGELGLPTGKESSGLGSGHTTAEAFGMISQVLPRDGFLHMHTGVEFPIKSDAANEAFWRAALGKTFSGHRWGRSWSPILELVTAKELAAGSHAEADLIPQMQVSLSTRQHILVSAGVRVPVNERDERHPAFLTYFLWDWFDGGLFSGW